LQLLLELDFHGKSAIELRGREAFSMRQIADLIAKQLGRPFPAAQTPRQADLDALLAHGMSHDFAHLMNDAWDTFSRHGLLRAPGSPVWREGTTPLVDFLRDQFIPALQGTSDASAIGLRALARASNA
jgi:hypothetical protein